MAGDYDPIELGEVAFVRSGFAFKSSDWTERGIPVVKIANVKDGRLVMDGCSFVAPRVAASAAEFALQAGDILIAMTGYIGDAALVRERDLPAALNQRVGRFSIRDPHRLDQRFLFYLLRDDDVRKEIEGLGYGSAQPNVSPSLIHGVEVPLPPLPEQRAIAHILGTLDDKIELNRRMNETLEAMARALFKSWFVDFDPVRAKAEGSDPGLTQPLADLFQDSFEDSELGEIPKGWTPAPVYDMGTFINGAAYRAFEPNAERRGLPIIKIAELKAGVTTQTAFSDACMPEKYKIDNGDILFSWSGNPDTSIDTFVWTGGPAWLNQHIFRVLSRVRDHRAFVLITLKHLRPVFAEIARNKQTTGLGHVTVEDLKQLLVTQPSEAVLLAWNGLVEPLVSKAFSLQQQGETLTTLRDTLLPKLIYGELRVKNAERFAAGVGP